MHSRRTPCPTAGRAENQHRHFAGVLVFWAGLKRRADFRACYGKCFDMSFCGATEETSLSANQAFGDKAVRRIGMGRLLLGSDRACVNTPADLGGGGRRPPTPPPAPISAPLPGNRDQDWMRAPVSSSLSVHSFSAASASMA
jgi:hypothetical protein